MTPPLAQPAPQFKGMAVQNGAFKEISLSDYVGQYVVLFYYPLNFNYVCPTEIIGFSDRAEDFRKLECTLIGVSSESYASHWAWINAPRKRGGLGELDMPLLSDKSLKIARDYGILDEITGIPYRGLFIIDREQNLRQVTVNDLSVGRSTDETLRLVQAFQLTDMGGEVCPANWRPGTKAMIPDTLRSHEYFCNVDAF